LADLNKQLQETEESEQKENAQKIALLARVREIQEIKVQKENSIASITEELERARIEPDRLDRNCESIEKAAAMMDGELKTIQRKIKHCEAECEKQQKKTREAEKLQTNLAEKIDFHRQTLQQREHDVSVVKVQLEREKAALHDILTQKVELNMKIKECDATARHKTEEISYLKKDYDNLKRTYKKKRAIVDSIKQILPTLNDQLVDQEHLLRSFNEEGTKLDKQLQAYKNEMDIAVAHVLEQEGIEDSKKKARKNETLSLTISNVLLTYRNCEILWLKLMRLRVKWCIGWPRRNARVN
jgi:chromosome segregation ATPase